METFGSGWIANAPLIDMSAKTLASLAKLPSLSDDMRDRLVRIMFPTPISSTDSSPKESCGSFYEMVRWSMNNPLEFMQTPAGLAEQFRSAAVIIAANSDSRDTVDHAFAAFCHRMSSGRILEALSNVVEYPVGSESTMIRFLGHLRYIQHNPVRGIVRPSKATVMKVIQNIERHLKTMEIASPFLDQCQRSFTWTERGVRMAARDNIPNRELYEDQVEQWTGKAHRKERAEPKSAIDDGVLNIYKCTYKADPKLVTFFWQIRLSDDGLIIAKGYGENLEHAADQLYKSFYRALTKKRCVDASVVTPGARLVIFGNWITPEEYMAYKNKANLRVITDAVDDSRNDHMFVIGYPKLGKDKALVIAHKITKARNHGDASSDNCIVTLRSGLMLDASDDWYVYRSEKNVLGEVMCMACLQVGLVGQMDGMIVRGTGMLCGPSRDELYDAEKIDDSQFDMQDILMPIDTQTNVITSE